MIKKVKPKTGQESVWDYPRPPRLEKTNKTLTVFFNQEVIARTNRGYRVLETSHPPVYYIPPDDVKMHFLTKSPRTTYCEFKGMGKYYHIKVGEKQVDDALWYYDQPTARFEDIKYYLAFYPNLMDKCLVDNELVTPQPGGFYGGWITKDIVGPFKGSPGTWGW